MGSPDSDVRSITLRLLRDRPVTHGRRLMLDRIRPRAVLVAALLAGLGSAVVGPAVPAAAVMAGLASPGSAGSAGSGSPGSASPGSASPGSASPVGGPELGGKGVMVNDPSRAALRLPGVAASAWVVADAR